MLSRRQTLIIASSLVLNACSRKPGAVFDELSLHEAASIDDEALVLLNAFRQQHNRGPLAINQALRRAASNQSLIMLRKQKMQHEFGRSTRFKKRLQDAGVQSRIAAENIAVGSFDTSRVMRAWIDSRPHRKNMLLNDIDRFGIAMRSDKAGRRWWTLIVAG